jgi:phosphoribosylanthranilate isomerase
VESTRVKFCGITRHEDAERAAELGAWAIGMIFWPGSERRCEVGVAAGIARALRRRIEVAGVFVNAPLDLIARTADGVGLTLLQLHGDEGPAYCAEAARRTGCRVIKAARIDTRAHVLDLRRFHTDFHLLDARRDGRWGGTGETWDWSLLGAHTGTPPVLLSGGLTPENVGEAIVAGRPWGVDVAGGVEAAPGVKDPARMEAFAAAAAASGRPSTATPVASP